MKLKLPIDLAHSIAIPAAVILACKIKISFSKRLKDTKEKKPWSEDSGLSPILTLINEPVPSVITQSPFWKAHSAITDDWESAIFN